MDETLAAIQALWRGEPGFRGSLISIDGGIAPLPVQPGGPPLWVGGMTKRAVRRAARYGAGWYASSAYSRSDIRRQIERYRAELASSEAAQPPRASANRLTIVAEDDRRAREQGRPHLESVLGKYAAIGAFRRLDGGATLGARVSPPAWSDEVCLIGSPETVTAQLEKYVEAGVTDVQLRVAPGDLPAHLVARTIRLVGTQVMPRFS
jgi:alkanesulfonate monooxygenase SsuD/methylene tetrahydromethanopterin reductase-like flavin-dependent oxidoreductase (luciferase family)